ncbi:MAG TPA: class I SAM-dependent methyltransferase [Vicinamibacterales bacterium]|nr:class I SAM-dependent methyltransferase [Vicinamibacterales bacterium]
MPGVSFDRAAAYYDITRGYAPGSAERIRDAIVAHAGATRRTRFLELGVGTGRIALPFVRGRYDYTGVDISRAMMNRLAARIAEDPGAGGYQWAMLQADVSSLPFVDGCFDVVIAVHVLHLVHDWQRAVREARRVLRRGGRLLFGNDDADREGRLQPPTRVRDRWIELRGELDPARHTDPIGWGQDSRLIEYLRALGASPEVVDLARFEWPPVSARQMLERYRARMYSSDWDMPDDLHAEALGRLESWMHAEIADPDEPHVVGGRFAAISATCH